MEFNQRERLLVIAVGICVCLFVGDRFVLSPLQGLWQTRSERIVKLESSLARGNNLLLLETVKQARWREMKRQSLPRGDVSSAESVVLKAVDRWARESRLAITSIKPRGLEEEKEYKRLEFQASAEGNWDSIARFLYNIEGGPTAIRLETVTIAARDEGGQQLSLNLDFSGLILTEE